ncbi:hypothetical protein KIN20_011105 [Parelaphostrongylus tenuis]|uniref:Uncharacterized protein n=1 Tax=Parelaphostrongylus tenuis TaxID=148309 RepID=A0AAD5MRL6_PARTN|nr:hypothetical protein KIN20_011105 [Parelaphostrongylus tenuis]
MGLNLKLKTESEEHQPNDSADFETRAEDALSDSDRADAEIDRIIAETNLMKTMEDCSSSVIAEERSVEGGGSNIDLADNDPETYTMRMNLLESLQNKVSVNKEREDGEVSDEDGCSSHVAPIKRFQDSSSFTLRKSRKYSPREFERPKRRDDTRRGKRRSVSRSSSRVTESARRYFTRRSYPHEMDFERSVRNRDPALQSKSRERRRHLSTSTATTSSTQRVGSSRRDATKGKGDILLISKPFLSSRLPFPFLQVVRTVREFWSQLRAKMARDRISLSQSTRSVKNTKAQFRHAKLSANGATQLKTLHSGTCQVPIIDPQFPQPQTAYHRATALSCMDDLLILPPPPAPPVLSKSADLVENFHPSSISVQVREGGERVAQLSSTTKAKNTFLDQKPLVDPKTSSQHLLTHPPPPPPPATDNPDNYDDVGMDVESSHSGSSSVTSHEDNEASTLARHCLFSEADEKQLREMLLNQVTINRMRKADTAANNSSSGVEGGNINLRRSVTTQTVSEDDNEQRPKGFGTGSSTSVNAKRCDVDWGDFSGPPRKIIKTEELNTLLKEKQTQLSELNREISERLICLTSSRRRRDELKKALNEVEVDINERQSQCRILMLRRNTITRAVERLEERKLDRLLSFNEWDSHGDAVKSIPSGEQTGAQSAGSISRSSSIERLLETGCSFDGSEAWNDEQAMRLKLLAKMKASDPPTSNSSQDMNGGASRNTEELRDQSTQTAASASGIDIVVDEMQPLYR